MSKSTVEITEQRQSTMRRAVFIVGGQGTAAEHLKVTGQTISRWCRGVSPIPEAAIFWAREMIRRDDETIQNGSGEG